MYSSLSLYTEFVLAIVLVCFRYKLPSTNAATCKFNLHITASIKMLFRDVIICVKL